MRPVHHLQHSGEDRVDILVSSPFYRIKKIVHAQDPSGDSGLDGLTEEVKNIHYLYPNSSFLTLFQNHGL